MYNFNFQKLEEEFNNTHLHNKNWSYSAIKGEIFGFQKIEMDYIVRKRMVVFPDLHVDISFNDKLHPVSKFITVFDMNHLRELMEFIDKLTLSQGCLTWKKENIIDK